MQFKVFGITDIGCVRSKNEDRLLINGKVYHEGEISGYIGAPSITAVCDGVGGERGGELAAQLCLEALSVTPFSSLRDIRADILEIHDRILDTASLTEEHKLMQTTLCALALDEKGSGYCINVGDSRLYRYANGAATLLSTDHTLVQYLYDIGEISAQEMKTSPDRNVIISSLGGDKLEPRIDITSIGEPLGSLVNDTVIVCTDGISDYVGKTEIEVCMGLKLPFEEKIDALFRLALSRGSCDNLSIIGITSLEEGI